MNLPVRPIIVFVKESHIPRTKGYASSKSRMIPTGAVKRTPITPRCWTVKDVLFQDRPSHPVCSSLTIASLSIPRVSPRDQVYTIYRISSIFSPPTRPQPWATYCRHRHQQTYPRLRTHSWQLPMQAPEVLHSRSTAFGPCIHGTG